MGVEAGPAAGLLAAGAAFSGRVGGSALAQLRPGDGTLQRTTGCRQEGVGPPGPDAASRLALADDAGAAVDPEAPACASLQVR